MSKQYALNHSIHPLDHKNTIPLKPDYSSKRGLNLCMVCEERKDEGIRILEQWICQTCESEIVRTEVEDEQYGFYIQRLRKLWLK